MQREKRTKITVYEDMPTSVSSSLYGANLDCFAFNMGYIVKKDSDLALQVLALYEKCKKLRSK
jgi:hypothetical protein